MCIGYLLCARDLGKCGKENNVMGRQIKRIPRYPMINGLHNGKNMNSDYAVLG